MKKAFSLVEVLVVIAVIAVVAVFTIPSFLGGSHETDLASATQQIVTSARQAQSQSSQEVKDASWGIHFSNATNTAPFYAVFSGSTYSTTSVQSVYRLPDTVGFVTSTLPTGSTKDVTFSAVSGLASTSTTISLYVLSEPSLTSKITIASAGSIAAYLSPTPGQSPSAQNIYISLGNGNYTVEEFSLAGSYMGQFGSYGSSNGQFGGGSPDNIAIDSSGNIWVVDNGLPGVDEFNSSNSPLIQFGSYGSGSGQFSGQNGSRFPIGPYAIATDASGNVWITDDGSTKRVEEYGNSGGFGMINQFGSYGSGSGQFEIPSGIAVDSSGNIWVVDGGDDRVEEFSPSGVPGTQFGTAGSGNGQLSNPSSIAIDANGNFWVVDTGNDRVEEFNSSGGYVNQFSGSGANQLSLVNPGGGIAIDANGNVWVADNGNGRVEEFSSAGVYMNQFGSFGAGAPTGIAIH